MKQMAENSDITDGNITFDLNLLKVFDQLFSELNVTRAAERLGVTQSAVSASLKKLRILYDDPLFERTQRGVKPTAKAILLRPKIEEALLAIHGTFNSQETSDAPGKLREVVKVGLSDDFELSFGAALIKAQVAKLPNVRIVFRQTNSSVVEQALLEREIDLALTSSGTTDSRIKKTVLGQSGYLCIWEGSNWPYTDAITREEYISRPHLLVSHSGLTGVVDEVLAEKGLKRNIIAATSHFSVVPMHLHDTGTIATIPAHAAQAFHRIFGTCVSPCPFPFPKTSIELSWRYDVIRKPSIAKLRELIATTVVAELKGAVLH